MASLANRETILEADPIEPCAFSVIRQEARAEVREMFMALGLSVETLNQLGYTGPL